MRRSLSAAAALLGAVMALSVLSGACASAARDTARRASDEMEAGYKAARRGYWQEALLRFERANVMKPQQGRILNNLAVALEAVGRYDEARATYETGLRIDPGDRNLKRNNERFKEVYASLIAEPDEGADKQGDHAEAGESGAQPEDQPEEGEDEQEKGGGHAAGS